MCVEHIDRYIQTSPCTKSIQHHLRVDTDRVNSYNVTPILYSYTMI